MLFFSQLFLQQRGGTYLIHISCLHNADQTHETSHLFCMCMRVCVLSTANMATYRATVPLMPVLSFGDLCLLAKTLHQSSLSPLLMLSLGLLEFLFCLGQHVLVELQAFFLFLQGVLQSSSQGFIFF